MTAELAAAYVGERTADAFERRVGTEYPAPVVDDGIGKGKRRLWLRRDLDRALGIGEQTGLGAKFLETVGK